MIVRIKSARDGYRRCGVAHPKQVTDHPADRFTEAELERLQADPVLTVTLVDGDLEDDREPSGGPGAVPAGASSEPAPATVPAAAPQKPAKVPAKATQKVPVKKGNAKANARGKGGAKAPAKEGTEAAQEGQSVDDANSSAKPAEGEGSEGGQE
ncbi:HI1506-related protein [Pseudomonas nitroreducens]|uniref:HI1506-related protein n=1 Tax=Pseudomonas nitroreducens TaxID=46680 RepID=UPI003CC81609